ncbi:hypothetical protein ACTXJ2_13285 [Psychrobacter alimentarius]|uniref:hypothetical protein n=1 Tax=Psychrobacter alimentarius TaxID=261164 RepID=UPI003FB9AB18
MDPFAFATIVGLLATFQSGREGKRDIEEFKSWLEENNHGNMVSIIENNNNMQRQLTAFMNQNHDQVMSQLATLNDLMVSIASHMQGLGNIASSFAHNSGLSDQAVDVLRQFVVSGSSKMQYMKNNSGEGNDYYILYGAPNINYSEPRFIKDDIDSLVKTGLITMSISLKNNIIYTITRQAVRFIDKVDNK